MAENKKGFVLYADLIHTINKMPSDKAGDLFKHILSYVNDEEPETDDILIDLVFEPIKQQLKRDLRKYEDKKVQWSEAGKRSAEARKAKKEATESTDVESRSTDSTVIVKDTVIVTVKDKDINNNIDSRETEFKNSLQQHLDTYGKDMLNNFYLYWTEKKPKGKKMRFELEKTFDISRRLTRWNNNNFNNNKDDKQNRLTEQQQLARAVADRKKARSLDRGNHNSLHS